MTKITEIHTPKQPATYAEVYQQLNIKFAWAVAVGTDFQLQHSYVKCRDFLPDFLWCLAHKAAGTKTFNNGIYGYYTQDHHIKSPFMALELIDGNVENLKANMEKFIPADAIKFVGSIGNQAIVQWSEEAMNAPWRISLFTFMLKLCCVKAFDTLDALVGVCENCGNEAGYLMAVTKPGLIKILKNWDKLVDEEQLIGNPKLQNLGIGSVHNGTGFVSMFKKSSNSKLAQQLKALAS